MSQLIEWGPWVAPFLSGAAGQICGMVVGYNILKYRVTRLERDHEACTLARIKTEESLKTCVAGHDTRLAVIEDRIDRRVK